jgi:small subunit ribosomal protein S13
MLVLGTHLKEQKAVVFALQAVFGLNYNSSLKVCSLVGVSPKTKLKQLRVNQLNELVKICREEVNNNLFRTVQNNLQSLISIKHYRGTRHMFGLPARGQRTRTNARTSKKIISKTLFRERSSSTVLFNKSKAK